MIKNFERNKARKKRHLRVRNKVSGTPVRPRLSVYRSNKNIFAQIIDDVNGKTLVSASTLDKDIELKNKGSNIENAKLVGETIAKKALNAGIESVVFDRSGYLYHGKIKELAESARATGLKF